MAVKFALLHENLSNFELYNRCQLTIICLFKRSISHLLRTLGLKKN